MKQLYKRILKRTDTTLSHSTTTINSPINLFVNQDYQLCTKSLDESKHFFYYI